MTLQAEAVRHAELNLHDINMLGRGVERHAAAWELSARELSDDHWHQYGYATRTGRHSASAEGAGLVSVPTSDTQRFSVSAALSEAITRGERAQLRAEICAFEAEAVRRRLAKLRMNVGFAARGHAVSERGHRSDECLMLTLTYAGSNADWKARHISEFLKRLRQWMARRGHACRYVWVAELQKRGVIHYHVALWVPRGVRVPRPDACGWWPHGMTRTERARAAVPYLLKYLSKDTSKTFGSFPDGSRIYGIGGLDHSIRRARRWLGLPSFVQGNSAISDDWKRCEGGGWLSPGGAHYAAEFRRVSVGGVYALQRVLTHDRSIEAAGPFNWLH